MCTAHGKTAEKDREKERERTRNQSVQIVVRVKMHIPFFVGRIRITAVMVAAAMVAWEISFAETPKKKIYRESTFVEYQNYNDTSTPAFLELFSCMLNTWKNDILVQNILNSFEVFRFILFSRSLFFRQFTATNVRLKCYNIFSIIQKIRGNNDINTFPLKMKRWLCLRKRMPKIKCKKREKKGTKAINVFFHFSSPPKILVITVCEYFFDGKVFPAKKKKTPPTTNG